MIMFPEGQRLLSDCAFNRVYLIGPECKYNIVLVGFLPSAEQNNNFLSLSLHTCPITSVTQNLPLWVEATLNSD